MSDPICGRLRKAARLMQENMALIGEQLPSVYAVQQRELIEQLSKLVEAYERRINELHVPISLPPVDIKHGGYEN